MEGAWAAASALVCGRPYLPITWSGDDTTVEIEGTSRELLDFAERIEHCSSPPASLIGTNQAQVRRKGHF